MTAYATAFQSFLQHCDQRNSLYRWFEQEYQCPIDISTVLSIGAGTGEVEANLLKLLPGLATDITLIEPNPDLADQITFQGDHVRIIRKRYEDCRESLQDKEYNLILLSHSVYYLEDPARVLRECYDLLAKDGRGLLMVINESIHGIHDLRKRYGGHESMLRSDQVVSTLMPAGTERYEVKGYIESQYLPEMLPFILPKFTDKQRAAVKDSLINYVQQEYGEYIYQPSVVLIARS